MNEMTRIVAAPTENFRARFTTAEFLRMCEVDAFEDWKIELVNGELERMPPPQNTHSRLQTSIFAQLMPFFGLERVRIEVGIDLGDDTVLGCDGAVLMAPIAENRWPRGDELMLVVEVSQTTLGRDLGMKAARYAAAGIPHYWVLDGQAAVVHAYSEPTGARYSRAKTVRFGEPLAVPGTDATITLS